MLVVKSKYIEMRSKNRARLDEEMLFTFQSISTSSSSIVCGTMIVCARIRADGAGQGWDWGGVYDDAVLYCCDDMRHVLHIYDSLCKMPLRSGYKHIETLLRFIYWYVSVSEYCCVRVFEDKYSTPSCIIYFASSSIIVQ